MSYRLLIVTIVCAVFFSTPIVWAVDEENCLLCHRYSGLGRIDEKGKKHLYYVNEALYNRSAHAKVRCGECHADIKGFPHGTVKKS
jgi:cytochrome c